MSTKKTGGRPAIMKTLGGLEITLPPSISKEQAESLLPIPASLNQTGAVRWIELWITCKDWIEEKDKYIAEMLCLKYQELQTLLFSREVNNIPPVITHSNKSKSIHPFWALISQAEKDYTLALKEMGLTPHSFAAIQKLEKIDSNDPLLETIKEMQESDKKKNESIMEMLEELNGFDDSDG